jgi:hypothetical protein
VSVTDAPAATVPEQVEGQSSPLGWTSPFPIPFRCAAP